VPLTDGSSLAVATRLSAVDETVRHLLLIQGTVSVAVLVESSSL